MRNVDMQDTFYVTVRELVQDTEDGKAGDRFYDIHSLADSSFSSVVLSDAFQNLIGLPEDQRPKIYDTVKIRIVRED